MVLQSTTSAVLTNSVIRLPGFLSLERPGGCVFAVHAVPRMHFVTGWSPS